MKCPGSATIRTGDPGEPRCRVGEVLGRDAAVPLGADLDSALTYISERQYSS
jgi:hypothetical protein